jgi:hypothetical protein
MRVLENLKEEALIGEKVKRGFTRADAVVSLWHQNKISLPWLKKQRFLWFPLVASGDKEIIDIIVDMAIQNGDIVFWADIAKSSIPFSKDLLIKETEKQLVNSWMCIYALREFHGSFIYPEITNICLSKLEEYPFVFDEWNRFVGDNKKFREKLIGNVIKNQDSITRVEHWLWINNNLHEIKDLANKKLGLKYD